MSFIKLTDLFGEAQKIMIIVLGVLAEDRKHTGYCLGYYDTESCNDCGAQARCLDLFQKEFHDGIEMVRKTAEGVMDAVDQKKHAERVEGALTIMHNIGDGDCNECEDQASCLEYVMSKTHTFDPQREGGSISQSAEKDEHIGFCMCSYVYDKCLDCSSRLDCLASYLKRDDENDAQTC